MGSWIMRIDRLFYVDGVIVLLAFHLRHPGVFFQQPESSLTRRKMDGFVGNQSSLFNASVPWGMMTGCT